MFLRQSGESSIEYHAPADSEVFIEEGLQKFFSLEVPFSSQLNRQWSSIDSHYKEASLGREGLRLLRLPVFETILSFICSANNNVKRIQRMVSFVKNTLGKIHWESPLGITYRDFPTAESLSTILNLEQLLLGAGFGYRAKFVCSTVAKIVEFPLEYSQHSLRAASYLDCKRTLMQLDGVGRKVADCICLMSCDKLDVVPIDVHVWRIARNAYRLNSKAGTLNDSTYAQIQSHFLQLFGTFCGWAQLVLFANALNKSNPHPY